MKRKQEFFQGCLIGGAIGDALGWPVEFKHMDKITELYGESGIQDLVMGRAGRAEITDDTQMTLFTAEGLLRAVARQVGKGICHPPSVVYYAYQRWLVTQGRSPLYSDDWIYDSWLLRVPELHFQRAPGRACLSALESGRQGSIEAPINDSKGCGGVMRVAPVGLFCQPALAFEMGAEVAALTHGHPSGYLSAGALASIIAGIIAGQNLETAVQNALEELAAHAHHEECTQAIKMAVNLAGQDLPDVQAITQLGGGWVGEEALAISLYCALKHRDNFRQALIAAVNHSGDSDSTGAITGNILGAYLGKGGIPSDWINRVELIEVIMQLADDLITGYQEDQEWWDRYPGC